MKKNCLLFFFLFFNCKAQNTTITVEKIDVPKFKNYKLYPGVLDNPKSESHIYIHENKIIQFYQDDKVISVQESTNDSPFKSQKLYSKKTLLLIREDTQFYNFITGISKIYDEKGILTKTINYDEKYNFTIYQLIEKLKKDYNIDFSTREGIGRGITRDYTNDKHCYDVTISLGPSPKSGTKIIVIDGNTGKTISESNHQYNEQHDERL